MASKGYVVKPIKPTLANYNAHGWRLTSPRYPEMQVTLGKDGKPDYLTIYKKARGTRGGIGYVMSTKVLLGQKSVIIPKDKPFLTEDEIADFKAKVLAYAIANYKTPAAPAPAPAPAVVPAS